MTLEETNAHEITHLESLLMELVKAIKDSYLKQQRKETVQIIQNQIADRKFIKFHVSQGDGRNLNLFKIAFNENGQFPVEVMTSESDIEYEDLSLIEKDIMELVNFRLKLLNKYNRT